VFEKINADLSPFRNIHVVDSGSCQIIRAGKENIYLVTNVALGAENLWKYQGDDAVKVLKTNG